MSESSKVNRRDFVKITAGAGLALGVSHFQGPAFGSVLGANDRINIGVIGVGGRGMGLVRWAMETGAQKNDARVVAVCDVYEKRKQKALEVCKGDAYLNYKQLLD